MRVRLKAVNFGLPPWVRPLRPAGSREELFRIRLQNKEEKILWKKFVSIDQLEKERQQQQEAGKPVWFHSTSIPAANSILEKGIRTSWDFYSAPFHLGPGFYLCNSVKSVHQYGRRAAMGVEVGKGFFWCNT